MDEIERTLIELSVHESPEAWEKLYLVTEQYLSNKTKSSSTTPKFAKIEHYLLGIIDFSVLTRLFDEYILLNRKDNMLKKMNELLVTIDALNEQGSPTEELIERYLDLSNKYEYLKLKEDIATTA